jgi:hypothetical protein
VVIAHAAEFRRSKPTVLLLGCWLCLCLAVAPGLQADPADGEVRVKVESTPDDAGPPQKADPDLRRKAIGQAFAMLAAIIMGGTLLLLLVVMWGNRARRLARKPLPTVARRDDLWFLKPKAATSAEQWKKRPEKSDPAD